MPKRPPEAGAAGVAVVAVVVVACEAAAPNKPPVAGVDVVAGCEDAAVVAGVVVFALFPNKPDPELWALAAAPPPNNPELPAAAGGAPAGVVDPPRENIGFAGVAVALDVGVLLCAVDPLLPKRPPLPPAAPAKSPPAAGAEAVVAGFAWALL